jgi:hypothetical protein
MAKIRSTAEIAKKWVDVTPQRTQQYAGGVQNPLEDWETNTAAAKSNFEQGVQASIARDGFTKGVVAAGTETWKAGATTKGVQRWGQGVSQGGQAYSKGFSPYRDIISNTELPPRFPRGDTRNYDRSATIGKALHDAKIAG